ncbi:MAG: diadenylate cyclase [Desulfobacterales bacterium]|nr:diadenylate cyclase [Desulfobacterales bacterium]
MMESILNFFASFRWQDVVDIGLNSYILFRFYVLFRGTYVFRVLIGLTMLWFFQQIAVYMGLIVTSWVVQGIVAVAALIIVVVFRNEIRTVLQARNFKTILWGFSVKKQAAPVDILANSVFELARRRHGALIVIPGEEGTDEHLQGGIAWNGDISKEMLLSIFFPDNPVHDGAAVIDGERITRVGAILPLSRRDDLPSHLGTRHRAALGLSEASDAIVVVVSEERGEVSLAKGSRLRPIANRSKLTQKLEEHFGIAASQSPQATKEKVEIATAAMVSLLFITGFWFSISQGLETLISFDVPIEYQNRNPNMEIVQASVNTVRLNLSGSGTLIKSTRPDQVRVRLDLAGAAAGANSFPITGSNVSLPPGLVLKDVVPSEVVVELDLTVRKDLPVQVDWVGRLPENLLLAEVVIEPQVVGVIGGKRILENISTLFTEKVPLDRLREGSGSLEAGLTLQPASLKLAPGTSEKVSIKYLTRKRE